MFAMVKVKFLVPPALDGKPAAERIFGCNYGIYHQPNLFVLYPATILKNSGFYVEIHDFVESKETEADFRNSIKDHPFDIYVFYTVFLSKKTDLIARDIIKKLQPGAFFIFMGTEATSEPEIFLDEKSVVCRGESESTIQQLSEALEKEISFSSIKGISWMRRGEVFHNLPQELISDLDALPFPDRAMLKGARYFNPKLSRMPFTTMVTSRGCSYRCYYCVPNSQSFSSEIEYKNVYNRKPPVRLRSAKNVIEEFRLIKQQGYRSVSIIDDQFVWGDQRIIEICRGIENLGLEWSCLARVDRLKNAELIAAMSRAGCRYIDIGIESFAQEILDDIGKDAKVDDVYAVVGLLKKYGIEPELNILIGASPLETKDTIAYTFKCLKKLDVDYVLFSICAPFPHTLFQEKAKQQGWMIVPEYQAIDPMRESLISYPHLTNVEMESIIKQLYIRYYFRPSYLVKRLKKIKGFSDLGNKIKTAVNFFLK
jgi:anaerobic magnesium-protoporphyrin IX monomethyl ester cyclase